MKAWGFQQDYTDSLGTRIGGMRKLGVMFLMIISTCSCSMDMMSRSGWNCLCKEELYGIWLAPSVELLASEPPHFGSRRGTKSSTINVFAGAQYAPLSKEV